MRLLRRTAGATIAGVLAAQAVLGSIFYLYGDARQDLEHTRRVQIAINDVTEAILLTENSNRAYLLTKDRVWLPEIDLALGSVVSRFDKLKGMGASDEFARSVAENLEPLIEARVARMTEARALVESDPEMVRQRLRPGGISHRVQTELRAALTAADARASSISAESDAYGRKLAIVFVMANAFIGFLFFVMVDAIANRFKKDLVTEKMLRKSLEDLMRELHHRVRNSLQSVNSLLTLQMRNITDPKARLSFADALGRVDAISRVHEHFYNEASAELPACKYVQGLVDNLKTLLPIRA
jgi:two-component sensor histidine kinase